MKTRSFPLSGESGAARLLRSHVIRFRRSRTGCVMRDICQCAPPSRGLTLAHRPLGCPRLHAATGIDFRPYLVGSCTTRTSPCQPRRCPCGYRPIIGTLFTPLPLDEAALYGIRSGRQLLPHSQSELSVRRGLRKARTMSRTGLLALTILLAALVNIAAADDRDLCNDEKAPRETRVVACTNAIATKQWRGAELAEKAAPGAVRKTRIALVIGNAEYKYTGRLANPVNDASDFANVLRTIGFEVIEGLNLDKLGMDEKIEEFARKLDKAGIGLFFYAGHAVQADDDNWLIPIDARIEGGDLRPERAAVVKTATISISQVLSKMQAEQRVNLVFLDACRDNPFGRGTGFGQAKGLAPIQNAVGTLTAFATKPHHVALDGDGRNSPFTTALLNHIRTPGLEIGAVMKRVRADVIKSTMGKQVPFDESSLI